MKKILLLLLIISNISSASVTYDLTGGNLTYSSPYSSLNVEATLSIIAEVSQTLTTQQEILSFFNSSLFSIKMTTSGGLLTEMNNSNTEWIFQNSGNILSTTLIVSPEKMTLVSNADDGGEIVLRTNGLNGTGASFGVAQFRTYNNTVNNLPGGNFIGFDYRAVNQGYEARTYGTPFVFNAVPEPSALSLIAVGLGGLAMMRRRRS